LNIAKGKKLFNQNLGGDQEDKPHQQKTRVNEANLINHHPKKMPPPSKKPIRMNKMQSKPTKVPQP
jgi:hypothetical protein